MNRTEFRPIRLVLGWLGALLVVLAALPIPAPVLTQSAQPGNRAGLIVRFSNSETITACIDLGTDGEATGEEVLRGAGLDLRLAYDAGAGAAVCKVNLLGCNFPQETCFCQCTLAAGTTCTYWAYFHLIEGRWAFSNQGSSSYIVRAGAVEGWSWGEGMIGSNGTQPPETSFDQICAVAASPTATATRTPTATLLPPALPPPTETPTLDPAFITPSATTTPSPSPTATETPSPTPSRTATVTPTPTRTVTATAPVEDARQALPTEPLPTEPSPTEPSPTPELAPIPETPATVAPYPAFTEIQPTEDRAPDIAAVASADVAIEVTASAAGAVALLPLVRGPEAGTATAGAYPLATVAPVQPAPVPAATVAPTPRLLPTAGVELLPEQAPPDGPGGNYLFFGLMIVTLAGTIIWLNMRQRSL